MTINDWATLFGIILATIGFVLGVLNYLRDRAQIEVTLTWDLNVTDNPLYDSTKTWAIVSAANVGRRSIFVSHAALVLPKGYRHTHLVLVEGLKGQKLDEGSPPFKSIVEQTSLEQFKHNWQKIRAMVEDASGRKWYSKRLKDAKIPSWAK